MITASLILNILVLIPVCFALIMNFEKMKQTAGVFTPARGIFIGDLSHNSNGFHLFTFLYGCETRLCTLWPTNHLQIHQSIYGKINQESNCH